jgi:glutamate N-acetyltransferase/amino-acid N-acetyltransferase
MSETKQCQGFRAAGMAAGIKKKSVSDLGAIYSEVPAVAAGVFTRNRVKAAPVLISQRHLASGRARAVIANAGNANCCTGQTGLEHAQAMAAGLADQLGLLPEDVLVGSTGVIGLPLPIDTIRAALPTLGSELRPDGFEDFARSIMTTDTVPKLVLRQGKIEDGTFTVLAAAKGAGMIRPDMATMLCFICTDADLEPAALQQCLKQAVDRTLNRISIDGDTSTNDMTLILANGLSGVKIRSRSQLNIFQSVLDDLLTDVARRLVKDGEGVTKLVEVKVQGAASDQEALVVVDTVAHSPLVKTAFFGEDANWGRIIGAVGRSGAAVDPARIDVYFDGVQMVRSGQGCGLAAEAEATKVLKQSEFTVTIDLHLAQGEASMLTCDFSVDYVKINADYRS